MWMKRVLPRQSSMERIKSGGWFWMRNVLWSVDVKSRWYYYLHILHLNICSIIITYAWFLSQNLTHCRCQERSRNVKHRINGKKWPYDSFCVHRSRHVCKLAFLCFNTLRPRQNGRLFADDIFKCIFLNENVRISMKISLNFVPKGRNNNIPALVQIMAWRRPGDKPLSDAMMISLLTHICVTRPQWVNLGNAVTMSA